MYATVNAWIWGAGLSLQLALLLVLVMRRVPRVLPVFTALIAFYSVRSAVLFAISAHLSQPLLGSIYNGFALVDPLLQMAVAGEITVCMMRQRGGWTLARGGLVAALAVVAIAAGWIAGALGSAHGRIPMDRAQLALSTLFVLLFAWAAWSRFSGVVRREMEGFAVYSAASLVSQVGRYRAALVRDGEMYIAWSYALAVLYLAVLVFWLLKMRRTDGVAVAEWQHR